MINANLPSTINHQPSTINLCYAVIPSVVTAAVTGDRRFMRGQSPQFHLETANPRVG